MDEDFEGDDARMNCDARMNWCGLWIRIPSSKHRGTSKILGRDL